MIQSLQRTLEDNHSHVWFRVYREHSRTITAMIQSLQRTRIIHGCDCPRVFSVNSESWLWLSSSVLCKLWIIHGCECDCPRVFSVNSESYMAVIVLSEFTENTRGQLQPSMIQSLQRTLEDNHTHSHVWFRVYREHSRTITAMYDSEFTENTRGQSQPWFRVYREHSRTISHVCVFSVNSESYMAVIVLECSL
jgi:hypothetical protein